MTITTSIIMSELKYLTFWWLTFHVNYLWTHLQKYWRLFFVIRVFFVITVVEINNVFFVHFLKLEPKITIIIYHKLPMRLLKSICCFRIQLRLDTKTIWSPWSLNWQVPENTHVSTKKFNLIFRQEKKIKATFFSASSIRKKYTTPDKYVVFPLSVIEAILDCYRTIKYLYCYFYLIQFI